MSVMDIGLFNFNEYEEDVKVWIAHAICGMVCADGVVDDIELDFLKRTLGFIGQRDIVLDLVSRVQKKEVIELIQLRGLERDSAYRIFLFLGQLALSDAELTDGEILYLDHIGKQMGFPSEVCHLMTKAMMSGKKLLKAEEKIIRIRKNWDSELEQLQKLAEESLEIFEGVA
jgi:hypothetical protein